MCEKTEQNKNRSTQGQANVKIQYKNVYIWMKFMWLTSNLVGQTFRAILVST